LRAIFDAGWRERALQGEPGAVKLLAESALAPLYAFSLYRVGRNHDLCEEVVQETLVRAIRDLHNYDPARAGDNIYPWLVGLARNEISRTLTRAKKNMISLEAVWGRMDRDLLAQYARLEVAPFGEDLLEREETRQLVNTTMSQLPPHYRDALEAKYLRGKSVRDLATLWSISEKAVESLLTRARQAFRGAFLALSRNLELELR
jgi:RNA polymerase sigma-70 factor (ECF subfamily)